MGRFGMVAAALAVMASPLLAQESTEDLKKELDQLRKEVDALKAVNTTKEIPAQGKIDADAMAADDNPIMTMFKGTKLSGFVDTGYEFSFNQTHRTVNGGGPVPVNTNPVRLFDNRDNSFYLNAVQLQLERLATKDMIVGYHVELQAGHDTQVIEGTTVTLQEGWLQILAPLGTGLDFRVGRMASLIGYEVMENINNMNYSRGAIFTITQPITTTGARASYSFVEQVSATVGVSNGLNLGQNAIPAANTDFFSDQDHSKMLEMQLMVKPTRDLWIAGNLNFGNDLLLNGQSVAKKFYIGNIVAEYKLDKLTVALNYEKSSAQGGGPGGGRAPFSGLAAYGKYQVTDVFATGVRAEYFSDERGTAVGPAGIGSRVLTLTLTEEVKIAQRAILRLELRHDDSNHHDFFRDQKTAKGDTTLGVEALMPF
jgi:hypothetical protein